MEISYEFRDAITAWLLRPNAISSVRYVPQIYAVFGSAKGRVRSDNQDKLLGVSFFARNPDENFRAFIACDGLGGMEAGERCAAVAAAAFVSNLVATAGMKDHAVRVRQAAEVANREVVRNFRERGATTIAALLVTERSATAVAVGDTRIFAHGEQGTLRQISRDDTIAEHVAALRKTAVSEADSPFANQLAQVIGQVAPVSPQIYDVSENVLPGRSLEKSQMGILVTTDGIHDIGRQIVETISRNASSARELVHRLLTVSDWMGGADNASAIYVAPQESFTTPNLGRLAPAALQLFDAHGELQLVPNSYQTTGPYNPPPPRIEPAEVNERDEEIRRKNATKTKKKVRRILGKKTRRLKKDKSSEQSELDIKVTQRSE